MLADASGAAAIAQAWRYIVLGEADIAICGGVETTIEATANFAVYRFREDVAETFVGRYEYTLVRRPDGLKIQIRKAILDLDALRPHGKLSIIL